MICRPGRRHITWTSLAPFLSEECRKRKYRMRMSFLVALMVAMAGSASGQTDWPMIGHDPGGTRYSPLRQINSRNVTSLKLAWSFNTEAPVVDPPGGGSRGGNSAPESGSGADRAARPTPRIRQSKTTPL